MPIHDYITVTESSVVVKVPDIVKDTYKKMFGRKVRTLKIRKAFDVVKREWRFERSKFDDVNSACYFAFDDMSKEVSDVLTFREEGTQTREEIEVGEGDIQPQKRRKVTRQR